MNLPDTDNIFKIIYRYKNRDFYLEGEDVKLYLSQLRGASVLGVTHGMIFRSPNWKIRNIKEEK